MAQQGAIPVRMRVGAGCHERGLSALAGWAFGQRVPPGGCGSTGDYLARPSRMACALRLRQTPPVEELKPEPAATGRPGGCHALRCASRRT